MARFTRRKKVTLGTAAVVLVTGGVAFAYWTISGSGTGTASTGNVAGITINQTSTITGLFPGGPAVDLEGTFDNGNDGAVRVNQVTVAVEDGWSVQTDAATPACTAADFVLVQPAATNADVPAGTNQGSWGGASIRLTNSATNQDNCKDVDVPLVYTSD